MGVRHAVAVAATFAMLFAFCGSASASTACPTDMVVPDDTLARETVVGVVCDLNVMRTREGLAPLRWDWNLWASAQRMAADIRTRQYFSHITPDGRTLVDRVSETDYLSRSDDWELGENLGWGSGYMSTPVSIVLGWMNSPSHRANVLEPKFEDVGIGVAQGSPSAENPTGMIYVANFGTRGRPVASVSRSKPRLTFKRGRGWVRTAWAKRWGLGRRAN
jgi:uncharacterized protein YkwD